MVSIIIINYNTFHLTSNCIKSIKEHTNEVVYEIILVDNNSTECDADLFLIEFPEIKLIKSNTNVGFAKGNNLGLKQAKGDCILLLNSDTELIENSILICLNIVNKNTNPLSVISPKLIYPNGDVQPNCQRFPSLRLELLEFSRFHKLLSSANRGKILLSTYFNYDKETKPDWIWGTFFMFNKLLLYKLPNHQLPDENFMYGEDREWCYLIKKLGGDILYTPKTKIIHHLSKSSSTDFKKQMILKNEREFILTKKNKLNYIAIKLIRNINKYLT